jgi:hypothetical protein
MKSNELAISEAVIRVLEKEHQGTAAELRVPDTEAPVVGPPVDCRFKIDKHGFSLEQTIVEAFAQQIAMDKHFMDFVSPLEASLQGLLPATGVYHLAFPLDPSAMLKPAQHGQVRSSIKAWVEVVGPKLSVDTVKEARLTGYATRSKTGQVAGIQLTLGLRVSDRQTVNLGKVYAQRLSTKTEADREDRIAQALAAKLGKLAACKAEGDGTILVFEWNDFILTNEVVIMEAIEKQMPGRSNLPDRVYLADTTIEDAWTIQLVVQSGAMVWDRTGTDFDPPDLWKSVKARFPKRALELAGVA